jgi:hypothetical protein
MTKKISTYIFILFFLSSCKFECSTDKNNPSTVKSTVEKIGNVTVTNNINITTNTTKLKSASLIFVDGERIPDDNVVSVNEKIKLKLGFEEDNTWKIINGKSNIGASEKITTDDGTVILNAGDLFKDYPEGLDADKVQTIKLSAIITKTVPSIKYFVVYFRVWDKFGDAELIGNYKFYVKK